MKTLNEMFRDVILQNELGGELAAALRFSHAEGGNSGYSFGVCQFDVRNSDTARKCLAEIGFTGDEIQSIADETVDPRQWNGRLVAAVDVIERYDEAQLSYCLDKALNFDTTHGIPVQSPSGVLAGADYCNQYGSEGQGAVSYYKPLGRPITAQDVLEFKLTLTKYGENHPKDCQRRFDGVMRVVQEAP